MRDFLGPHLNKKFKASRRGGKPGAGGPKKSGLGDGGGAGWKRKAEQSKGEPRKNP